ncbi:hypothetical protein LZD49_11870 [Dyadobacter sp. CY261]|uniref:hypothetical protein n=1 Tax=Dyadobacter sp. CY261 TaxID=2907203 RepID=UPI001F389DED|nr:hypothetical protein [Dyadobacter sp. CY261]MCF0071169.1 hypothetical protein [Dyadobacter sp. CY261]
MDEFNKYHLEKLMQEHPEKVIKIDGPMPEWIKRAIIEKQEWAEEVRSRGKIDVTKLKQKIIV